MTQIDLTDLSTARGGSQPLNGYLAKPAGEGPWPGVVMIHEILGLDAEMLKHAERLAAMGYLTLAVNLFSQGGARRCLVSTMSAMRSGKGRAFTDIEIARGWLKDSPDCTGRVGVIGFCMGGGFALLAAGSGYDAAAANYGMVPKDVDAAMAGACPVVGSYGARDKGLKDAAAKLEAALTKAGVAHDVKEYPTAGHAFLNEEMSGPRPLRPLLRVAGMGPDPVAAADAWQRIGAFFKEHLGAAADSATN
jgi:carboxymethylenebutenolidase